MASAALRAELSRRLRTVAPEDWQEFSALWMAFNAIYGGEPDQRERGRVTSAIRRFVDEPTANRVLRASQPSIERIAAIPPGDMRRDSRDPRFRAASQRCIAIYRAADQPAVVRLAGVGGLLYQVRCNLLHGSKDPGNERDRMLVTESLAVLRELVPALEAGAAA
jgi:hypothetical protein